MSNPVRFSHLRAFGRSGLHGHYARTAQEDEQTNAMEKGTAVHSLLFGPGKVIGYPGSVRRGKEYDAFVDRHPGYEILTQADYEKCQRMADAVSSSTLAAPYLKGTMEDTLFFKWMGLDCRATPDVRGSNFVTELKTCSTSDPARFIWHARKMCYHAQLRFQESAVLYALDDYVRDHWIVAVESSPPYPVSVFHLEPEARMEGEKLLTLWAERLKNCEASNVFPAYSDAIVPLCWPKEDELIYEEAA